MPNHLQPRDVIVIRSKNFAKKDEHGQNRLEQTKNDNSNIVAAEETDDSYSDSNHDESLDSSRLTHLLQNLNFQAKNPSDARAAERQEERAWVAGEQVQGLSSTLPCDGLVSFERRVRFSKATIYEHPVIPGDNPACSSGIPLTIDWQCIGTNIFWINKSSGRYEDESDMNNNSGDNNNKGEEDTKTKTASTVENHRNYLEMRIPASIREEWMRHAGYSRAELVALTRPVNIARAQRRRTVETLSLSGIQEQLERARKGVARKLCFVNKQKRQRAKTLKKWRQPSSATHINNADELEKFGRSSISTASMPSLSRCSIVNKDSSHSSQSSVCSVSSLPSSSSTTVNTASSPLAEKTHHSTDESHTSISSQLIGNNNSDVGAAMENILY